MRAYFACQPTMLLQGNIYALNSIQDQEIPVANEIVT